MTNRKTSRLYVSFWDIALDNLPNGTFRSRTLNATEAKDLVAATRREGELLGVTADDLFAPYKKREQRKHAELRSLLAKQFDISLALKDFCATHEDEHGEVQFIKPLQVARVSSESGLLVISCSYSGLKTMAAGDPPEFEIAPDSVMFHIFEWVDSSSVRLA